MVKVMYSTIIVCCLFSFMVGAKVGKETTESDMYHRDYNKCVENIPRNKDCVAVKIEFKVVESGN